MAKETKAQRAERLAAEQAVHEAEQAATYPAQLLATLERAQNVNFEVKVKNSKFFVEDRDDRRDRSFELSLTWSKDSQEALQSLDWRVELKEEAEREAARKAAVRQAALAKLNEEERELLGLR